MIIRHDEHFQLVSRHLLFTPSQSVYQHDIVLVQFIKSFLATQWYIKHTPNYTLHINKSTIKRTHARRAAAVALENRMYRELQVDTSLSYPGNRENFRLWIGLVFNSSCSPIQLQAEKGWQTIEHTLGQTMFRKTVRLLSQGNIPREEQTTPTSSDTHCARQEIKKGNEKCKRNIKHCVNYIYW